MNERTAVQVRRQVSCYRIGVRRLDTKQHQIRAPRHRQVDARREADHLDTPRHVQAQTVAFDGLHMRGAPDQGHAVSRARKHCAEETADGARADDSNRVKPLGHRASAQDNSADMLCRTSRLRCRGLAARVDDRLRASFHER